MGNWIPWLIYLILSNIPLEMLLLACGISIYKAVKRQPLAGRTQVCDEAIGYVLFFAVGISGVWGFIMHAFFAPLSSHYIGWQPSPFEFEVAVANLGFGIAGLMALWRGYEFRLATIIMITCFSWGAAIGHIYQMHASADFAAGNAGSIFYTDILIPAILWFLVLTRSSKTN